MRSVVIFSLFHQRRGPLSMVHFLVGLNLLKALLAVLPRVSCPLDLRHSPLPQPRPLYLELTPILFVKAAGETCLIGSLLWKWSPRVQHVVSILFSRPLHLSNVLVHGEEPLIIEDHRVAEAFMTMPLTVPSLMYSGNRKPPSWELALLWQIDSVHRAKIDSTDS